MKYRFIREHQHQYPVQMLCNVMQVSRSQYYAWRPAPESSGLVGQELHIRMRSLFSESEQSLGSRSMTAQLRKEGFSIGRHRVRKLMKDLKLSVKRKRQYVVTTESQHSEPVAPNLLDRNFNPAGPNQIWSTDITYIKTRQGWVYLAVVLDLYSRRVVGWHIDRQMTVTLVSRALRMAINLRQPPRGLLHHSDRGVQYACKDYQKLLQEHGMRCSMSRKGNCWDNAPTERFFGSLKRERVSWRAYHDLREVQRDVSSYMLYYNTRRLHSTLNYRTPVAYELGR